MFQRFSMIFAGTNQTVSGLADWPLSPFLPSADVPLSTPLTLPRQEGFRATKSGGQVILLTHQETPGSSPEQQVSA